MAERYQGRSAMNNTTDVRRGGYEPPSLRVIGSVAELTLGCDKRYGSSDGFTFSGNSIVCASP
jgi:hypothetical protein